MIAFISLEIGLRVWLGNMASVENHQKYSLYTENPPEERRWSKHHYLNYYPTPNYKSGMTSHNSLGYRGKEFKKEKADGVFRIVAMGGSTTYTIEVEDDSKTFPAQLEKVLRKKYGKEDVEVINAGVGGYNSWETLINLQFRALDLEPDMVIIYQGTNDVHCRFVRPEEYAADNSGRRKQWEEVEYPFYDNSLVLRIIRRRVGLSHQVGLGTFVNSESFLGAGSGAFSSDDAAFYVNLLDENKAEYFERNLRNMVAVAKENDVAIILSTFAHSPHFDDYASTGFYQRGFLENNGVVKKVAEKYGAHLFDFATVMPKDKRLWADGRHVNEEGALVKAGFFAEYIDMLLKNKVESKALL